MYIWSKPINVYGRPHGFVSDRIAYAIGIIVRSRSDDEGTNVAYLRLNLEQTPGGL